MLMSYLLLFIATNINVYKVVYVWGGGDFHIYIKCVRIRVDITISRSRPSEYLISI